MVMDTSAPPHIEFRGVTFSYTGTSKTIDNVNLTVPHGQYAAFVGPSGSGKSTILTLALRFYDPLAGSICIGGQDIRSVTQDSLRARMAVVLQDNMLFRISVRENIRCARPGATGEESNTPPFGPGFTTSSSASPTDTILVPEAAVAASPEASANASPLRAPCSAILKSCCSTKRHRPSTAPPKRRSTRPSSASPRVAR
jgi:hypothetical protein